MRPLILAVLALALSLVSPVMALHNGPTVIEATGSTQTDRLMVFFWQFAPDEICNYPKPNVVGASAPAVWQSNIHSRYAASAACPGGAVKNAWSAFHHTLTASSTTVFHFVNDTNACSLGNEATCNAAAPANTAAVLAWTGWSGGDIVIATTPAPNGASLAAQTVSARAMITAGHWSWLLRGPVVNRLLAEDRSTSRTYHFGYKGKREFFGNTGIASSTTTTIPVTNIPDWLASKPRPFLVSALARASGVNETFSVCWVDLAGNNLIVGTTNGSDSSCANSAGRGQSGTTAKAVPNSSSVGMQFTVDFDTQTTAGVNSSTTSLPVVSTTNPGFPFYIRLAMEILRPCNAVDSTTFRLGNGTAGSCTSGSSYGRKVFGSHFIADPSAGAAVSYIKSDEDWWINAEVDNEKSISPAFVVDLVVAGEKIRWDGWLENTEADRRQDQWINLEVSDDDGVEYSRNEITFIAGTRLRFPVTSTIDAANPGYWFGTPPGAIRIDFNFPYKKHIGIIPNDPSIQITQGLINQELTGTTTLPNESTPAPGYLVGDMGEFDTFSIGDNSLNTYSRYQGPVWRDWPGPGGRQDLSPMPRALVTTAYSWGRTDLTNYHRMNEYALALGAVPGRFPHHWREHDASRKFCDNGGYPANTGDVPCPVGSTYRGLSAFGRPLTLSARPQGSVWFGPNVPAGDALPASVGQYSPNGIPFNSISYAHSVDHYAGLAAMMTGQKFYLDEVMWGGFIALMTGSIPNYTASPSQEAYNDKMSNRYQQRGCDNSGCMGWYGVDSGYRHFAWMKRDHGNAVWATPEGTPERVYLDYYWRITHAVQYGFWGLQGIVGDTAFNDCVDASTPNRNTPYCFGVTFKRGNSPSNGVYSNGGWTFGYQGGAQGFQQTTSQEYAFSSDGLWHTSYAATSEVIHEGMGLPYVRAVRTHRQRQLLHMLNSVGGINPFLVAPIEIGTATCRPEGVPAGGGNCSTQEQTYGSQFWFSSFGAMKDAMLSVMQNCQKFGTTSPASCTTQGNCSDLQGGYCRLAHAHAAFLFDGVHDPAIPSSTALKAWRWMEANVTDRTSDKSQPTWVFSPPNASIITGLRQSGTNLYFERFDGSACGYAIDPTSSIDSGDTAIPAGITSVTINITGISAGSKVRVTCGYRGGPKYARQTWTVQ